jgi:predicted ATPase
MPPDERASSRRRASDGASAALTQARSNAVFVGRQAELHQLKAAFEATASGQGALMLLVGEPGIGKTALCDQLGRFVAASGGVALVGHCYEETAFRRPYQPFVEAFGTYLQETDLNVLADLGPDGSELARIVPSVSERIHVLPRPPGDPEEDRWRLLDAAVHLLRSAAAHQPLLLVLEDLHDADRGTLDLLLHVSRSLHRAPLLVVGTYRDVEVDRAHPLSAALIELHRASNVARIHLHGLSTGEVQRLLAETSQQTIPQPFAELVQRQTEGNPLFVRETLRFVLDSGLMERRDGVLRRVGDQSLAGRIPEGLRDAVGKRLSKLGDSTNRVLSVASVLGREFQLDVLSRVLAGPEEELEAALEEASAAGIIEERSVVGPTITYRFSHAFFRQTLYDEIVAPRRIRLHQQVARSLEEVHGARLEEHAAELAEHYAFSSDTSDLLKAVHYGELAGRRATDVFAYGDAARQLERALLVLELADPDDKIRRCDLLLALGEALWPAGETERVIADVAPAALALAEGQGDRHRAFRACRMAVDCFDAEGGPAVYLRPEYLRWAELAHRYTDVDSKERIYADLALALAWGADRFQQGLELRREALALARQHDDAEGLFRAAFSLMLASSPQAFDEQARLAAECTGWPRQGVSGQTLGLALWFAGLSQLACGNRPRAEELWREVEQVAERTRVVSVRLLVPQSAILLAIVDGRLEDVLVQLERYVEEADELGASQRGRMLYLSMLKAPAVYLGRSEVWLRAFEDHAGLLGPGQMTLFRGLRATCLVQLGRLEEARSLAGPVLDDIAQSSGDDDIGYAQLTNLLEVAVALRHRAAAGALLARLGCIAHLSIAGVAHTCVARHLGDAAALAGDRAAARAYYLQALEAAGRIGFRPELALTRLRLAELLLEEGDDAEAQQQLTLALPELQEMKMQPALERALTLGHKLAPAPAHIAQRTSRSDGLTAREREIASLIAEGQSNHEIAVQLVITEGTVEVHVKHILSKLNLRSRTQVAAWLAEHRS